MGHNLETRSLMDELRSLDKPGGLFDFGHPLLNRIVGSFVTAAGIGAVQAVSREACFTAPKMQVEMRQAPPIEGSEIILESFMGKLAEILLKPCPRAGGLVDYEDDDDDDEDYKPPPKTKPEKPEEDEEFRLKRKISASKEANSVKKRLLNKTVKSKESVFATLCSTLSQAVLPSKNNTANAPNNSQEPNEKGGDNNNTNPNEADQGGITVAINGS